MQLAVAVFTIWLIINIFFLKSMSIINQTSQSNFPVMIHPQADPF